MEFPKSDEVIAGANEKLDARLKPLTSAILSGIEDWSGLSPEVRRHTPVVVELSRDQELLWQSESDYVKGQLGEDLWGVEYRSTPDYGHDRQPGDVDEPPKLFLHPTPRF